MVTVGRSDYGIYVPLLRRLREAEDIQLRILAAGTHLSPEFGRTVDLIERDGFSISARVEMLLSSDSPEGIAKSMGLGVAGFAQVYGASRPDLLVALGDRFEMLSAVAAAVPFNIPVAHLHGGEITQGAIDEAFRHAITKMSHLHFVATAEYGRRVAQMGEEAWRITVSGAPALDHLRTLRLLSREDLAKATGLRLDRPPLLVTFHPVTLEYEQAGAQVDELLAALKDAGQPVIFTMPNADTGGRAVRASILRWVQDHPLAQAVENLGTEGYFSLMSHAAAMVGNSSSGLIEAPSLGLPVVNIGSRQAGRVRAANVIDVEGGRAAILSGIHQALVPDFRQHLSREPNPYGDGTASERIVARLKTIALDDRLLRKRFVDHTFVA